MCGVRAECKKRYSIKLWKQFGDTFNCLPFVAVVEEKIICMHGGLSPSLTKLEQLRNIKRPTEVPDEGLLCDVLWSDPDPDAKGWGESDRGVSFTFGADVVAKFLQRTDLDLVCRAHQVRTIPAVAGKPRRACDSSMLVPAGCGGRLRVLRAAAARDDLLRAQLLRRVRQQRRDDVRRREPDVLFPGPQAGEQEGAAGEAAAKHTAPVEGR